MQALIRYIIIVHGIHSVEGGARRAAKQDIAQHSNTKDCYIGVWRSYIENIIDFLDNIWNYYLYQAIWRSNKSVYLILSGKSTWMRTIF